MKIFSLSLVERPDIVKTAKKSLQLGFIGDNIRKFLELFKDMLLKHNLSFLDLKTKNFISVFPISILGLDSTRPR